MDDSENRTERKEQVHPVAAATADTRQPYEAPKLVKKRSVARATLLTAMGPMANGLTMTG